LKILVLEGLDWGNPGLGQSVLRSVNFRPKRFTAQVQTGLVCVDPLSAIFLFVALLLAENTGYLVPVRVVAWIRPPLLLVIVSKVVLWAVVLTILLASILLVRQCEHLLSILGDGLNIVFFFLLLDSLDPGCASGPWSEVQSLQGELLCPDPMCAWAAS
jgi:hypothetical protein